ncbi:MULTISPECIES: PepSY domain-containing protein [unclassified Neisseria]|uniref:PepSY domain-containing protein n=1 Tax=unclassified Neisseria TaxID=2623750 RepID=UPI002666DE83|nr:MULTISPECIES: PepSY domain-containing protein [unclassified Neisseria]MDO1509720.1 PepSY domain-containing protein [Neisseria sp. MVDL19-042950]MDO1515956.1 PepSY domain-containing protein [Neisseria sp. MVDL18-041461]MDO1563069.1 PepSY domain-containing protein [Neisseria sp. MVDL20-010259]
MLNLNKTIAVLLASVFAVAAAPVMADDDYYLHQNPGKYITHDAAAKAALKKFPNAYIKEVDFDMSRYRGAHYDVDLITKDGREYDVIIDARNGKILSSHIDY